MNTGSTQGPPQHNEPNTCMYTGTLPLDLDWPTRARTELGYYVSSQEKEPESQSRERGGEFRKREHDTRARTLTSRSEGVGPPLRFSAGILRRCRRVGVRCNMDVIIERRRGRWSRSVAVRVLRSAVAPGAGSCQVEVHGIGLVNDLGERPYDCRGGGSSACGKRWWVKEPGCGRVGRGADGLLE